MADTDKQKEGPGGGRGGGSEPSLCVRAGWRPWQPRAQRRGAGRGPGGLPVREDAAGGRQSRAQTRSAAGSRAVTRSPEPPTLRGVAGTGPGLAEGGRAVCWGDFNGQDLTADFRPYSNPV